MEDVVMQEDSDRTEEKNAIGAALRKILQKIENSDAREKNENQKILEELQSIREILGEKKKIRVSDKEIPEVSKADSNGNSSGSEVRKMSSGKCFVIKEMFENVSEMEEGEEDDGEMEEHFGSDWYINIERKENHLAVLLFCGKDLETGKWSIETEFELKVKSRTGETVSKAMEWVFGNTDNGRDSVYGEEDFVKWEKLLEEFLIDDKLAVEVHVKINKMIGVYGENLRNFDQERHSDVALIVGDRKFYVSKLFLTSHSTYFDALFLGQFQESKMAEITISDVDPDDFQKFLEVLYGDPAIDGATVEGILLVADMYDTQIVIEKCEDFLLKESPEKTMIKMLELATRYNLKKLKQACLSLIETADAIQSILPSNLEDLDHSIMTELFKKSLSLH